MNNNTSYPDIDCKNAFSSRVYLNFGESATMKALFVMLAIFTIITNSIVIYRLVKSRQLQKVSSLLIFVLSISDLCTGALTLPLVCVLFFSYENQRFCELELVTQFISTSFVYISIVMTMLVGLDRVIHQTFPTRYKVILSKKAAAWSITIGILSSVGLSALLSLSSIFNQITKLSMVFSILTIIIIVIVFISYFKAYFQISRHVRRSVLWKGRRTGNMLHNAKQRSTTPRYLREFGRTVFLIVLVICLCYIPFVTVIIASFIVSYTTDCVLNCHEEMRSLRFALFLSYVLIYSNSGFNALIIIRRNSRLFQELPRRKIGVVNLEGFAGRRGSYISSM